MTPFDESHKLIRCEVINRYQEISVRLIEVESFKLWEYLMTHKHGLQVRHPTPCLWISQNEFDSNPALFEHAGDIEAVDRIIVDLYDEAKGYSQTSIRYSRHQETEGLLRILKAHLPPELQNTDAVAIQVIHGQTVQKWKNLEKSPTHLSLVE